jgi:hypothetical protein
MADEPLTPTTTTDDTVSAQSGSDHWPPLVGDSERADPNERTPPRIADRPRAAATPASVPETPASESEAEPPLPGVAVRPHQRGTPGKPLSESQKRINELTWRQREAERERDSYRERLDALEAQLRDRSAPGPAAATGAPPLSPAAPSRDPNRPKPTVDQFRTYEEWVDAVADWKLDRHAAAIFQATIAQQQQQAQTAAQAAFEARRTDYIAAHPDYAEVVGASDVPVSETMDQFFTHDPSGVAAIYYLAQHPEDARRISELAPGPALVALGRIAQIVEAHSTSGAVSTGPRSPLRAPTPITPVGAGAHRSSDYSDLEFGPEYVRRGNESDRSRRKAGLR